MTLALWILGATVVVVVVETSKEGVLIVLEVRVWTSEAILTFRT
jgi:hypothetical protein